MEKTTIKVRGRILDEARRAILSDRNGMYGEPEDNFGLIAELLGVYLSEIHGEPVEVDAHDVAMMMTLFKVGRIATARIPAADSYADLAGYAACAGEIAVDVAGGD